MEGGLLKEKKGREGVLGKTALLFYLPTRTRRGGHGGGREEGETEEGSEGVRFPYLPRAEVACGDGATRAGGRRPQWIWQRRSEAGEWARGG